MGVSKKDEEVLLLAFTPFEVEGLLGDMKWMDTPNTPRQEKGNNELLAYWKREFHARMKEARKRERAK